MKAIVVTDFGEPEVAPPPVVEPVSDEPVAAASCHGAPFFDVLGCPVGLLGSMPAPSTLEARDVTGRVFAVTNSRAGFELARAEGSPVFVTRELALLGHAAEHDRMWPQLFATLCARKLVEPADWRVSPEVAFAGVWVDAEPTWTLGQVFRRIGAVLISVRVEA